MKALPTNCRQNTSVFKLLSFVCGLHQDSSCGDAVLLWFFVLCESFASEQMQHYFGCVKLPPVHSKNRTKEPCGFYLVLLVCGCHHNI